MIYDEYLTQSELQRWILDADVSWSRIDVEKALAQPELLDQIRDSALIESVLSGLHDPARPRALG